MGQTPLPISVDVLVLPATGDPTTVTPIATRNIAISPTLNCGITGQGMLCPIPCDNPSGLLEFEDPFTLGKFCRVPAPANLPNGKDYRIVGFYRFTAPTPDSPRSLVGIPLFNIIPLRPTGLVVK